MSSFVKIVIAGKMVFEIPDSVFIKQGDYIISLGEIEHRIDDFCTFIKDSNEYDLFKAFVGEFNKAKAIHREESISYDTLRDW